MARKKTGGELLREALQQAGTTLKKLEDDLDVASGLVTRWINGQRVPSIEQAILLRNRYEIPVEAWVRTRSAAA